MIAEGICHIVRELWESAARGEPNYEEFDRALARLLELAQEVAQLESAPPTPASEDTDELPFDKLRARGVVVLADHRPSPTESRLRPTYGRPARGPSCAGASKGGPDPGGA